MGNDPPKYMKQILHLAEPIALHMRLFGGLCTKGQREVPKAPMLEIIERISGVNVNSEVGDDKALWQVALFVHRRNLMLGRPCKEVHLPVDWSQFGPFVLVEHGGGGRMHSPRPDRRRSPPRVERPRSRRFVHRWQLQREPRHDLE